MQLSLRQFLSRRAGIGALIWLSTANIVAQSNVMLELVGRWTNSLSKYAAAIHVTNVILQCSADLQSWEDSLGPTNVLPVTGWATFDLPDQSAVVLLPPADLWSVKFAFERDSCSGISQFPMLKIQRKMMNEIR